MALTELALKNLKPKSKPYRVPDGGNLSIEVSPAGGKHWRWRYVFAGKPDILSLGKYPAVSLAEARKRCDEVREILKSGKHPGRERRAEKQRQIAAADDNFASFARDWLKTKHRAESKKYRQQCLKRMQDHVFPRIGNLSIPEITAPMIVRVIEAIGAAGTIETAKRMGQLLKQIFRYGVQRGLCSTNPAADLQDVLPRPKKKHHACIHPRDMTELLQAMAAYKGEKITVHAMHLMALTFVRTSELIAARWDEVDWEKRQWDIPKERMKMKRPHVVPLCDQSIATLTALRDLTGDKSHIFFSAASKSKHLSNGVILMALDRMGYHGLMTGHGFRSLASTILNENGFNRDVVERQLAHEDEDEVRSAYNRAEYLAERVKMMQWWGDHLDEMRAKIIEPRKKKVANLSPERQRANEMTNGVKSRLRVGTARLA
ncbi:integrase [Capsulimonas corticalis]|uniref:Integrase n=1 Tax=Capsulimonas corticalis TaxID=2219043 RepID=A0A402D505_9BACT|nr:integrase arm-type DNA-binding domain-containing protein [Capsulimonas corticalis]BDI32580.1 integrase [Capsulimonas corticalis]